PSPAPIPQPSCNAADPSPGAGYGCVMAFFKAWMNNDTQAARRLADSVCENCDVLFPPGDNGNVFTYSSGWDNGSCGPDADNPPSASNPQGGVVCTYTRPPSKPDPSGRTLGVDANGNYTLNFYAQFVTLNGRWEVNRVLA